MTAGMGIQNNLNLDLFIFDHPKQLFTIDI